MRWMNLMQAQEKDRNTTPYTIRRAIGMQALACEIERERAAEQSRQSRDPRSMRETRRTEE
jgi:hypothetical protein